MCGFAEERSALTGWNAHKFLPVNLLFDMVIMGTLQFSSILLLLLAFWGVQGEHSFEVVFTKAPTQITSETNATLDFVIQDTSGVDMCNGCSVKCKLDDGPYLECPSRGATYTNVDNGRHVFEVSFDTSVGAHFSAEYSWTVDSVPPTASLKADSLFTNAAIITFHILFSEPCAGGFSCINASNCNLAIYGPGSILPASLQVIQQNMEYKISVELSKDVLKGRIQAVLAKGVCRDDAGNVFQRNSNSSAIVHFDRSNVSANIETKVPVSQLTIGNETRSIQVTNKLSDLYIYLDFTSPVVNSSSSLLSLLHASTGVLHHIRHKTHGGRRFDFQLTDVPDVGVISITFDASTVMSMYGTNVSSVIPKVFLYDAVRPEVRLSTTSRSRTTERLIEIMILFSEPVFYFEPSDIAMSEGNITSFKEVSKRMYLAEIYISRNTIITAMVPENRSFDIAGNPNYRSNMLQLNHYNVPAVSVVSYTFTTVSLLATTLASGAMSTSTACLAAAGALSSRTAGSIISDPSRNLLGMASHLQVFALSYWSAVSLPIDYYEAVNGLQWLIPHLGLPWEKTESLSKQVSWLDSKIPHVQVEIILPLGNLSTYKNMKRSSTHLYLEANEYDTYFENQDIDVNLSLSDLERRKYVGWHDFASNMFWLSAVAVVFVLLHLAVLLFLRWRTKTSLRGALSIPRFELFLLIIALPCICQASSFLMRGGTTGGIIVGVLILAIPTAFLLSLLVFLLVAVIIGGLVQYKEYRHQEKCSLCQKISAQLLGSNSVGKWIRKEGISATFLPRYGLLFENRKGPPSIVVLDEQHGSKWVDSRGRGIGRMRAVNSDDDGENIHISKLQKLLGAARISYIVVDVIRRVVLGIIFGAYAHSETSWRQVSIAFGFTATQLVYLLATKPYIRRGVQFVEVISLMCETTLLGTMFILLQHGDQSVDHSELGICMLLMLFLTLAAHIVNEWHALMEQLLRLSPSHDPSLKIGLKMFGRGLLLPLIPRDKWSKFVTPQPGQPQTGLSPVVVHSSPSPEFIQRNKIQPAGSPSEMRYDPGSPSLLDGRNFSNPSETRSGPLRRPDNQENQWTRSNSFVEGKKSRLRADPRSVELRMLRELAKASFPGSSRKDSDQSEVLETVGRLSIGGPRDQFYFINSTSLEDSDELTPRLPRTPMEVVDLDYPPASFSSEGG